MAVSVQPAQGGSLHFVRRQEAAGGKGYGAGGGWRVGQEEMCGLWPKRVGEVMKFFGSKKRTARPVSLDKLSKRPRWSCFNVCEKCDCAIDPGTGILLQGGIYSISWDEKNPLSRGRLIAGGERAQSTLTAWHTQCLWVYLDDQVRPKG